MANAPLADREIKRRRKEADACKNRNSPLHCFRPNHICSLDVYANVFGPQASATVNHKIFEIVAAQKGTRATRAPAMRQTCARGARLSCGTWPSKARAQS